MSEDYRQLVKALVLDEANFVQLTLKGKISAALPWRQALVRPVLIKNQRYLQVAHFTARQDITKNYSRADVEAKLDELLALPFTSLQVQSSTGDLSIQITQKGKAIVHRQPARTEQPPDLAHDAAKNLPLPADKPDSFLQAVGIMTAEGRIKTNMQGKFAQVNEFLKLLDHTHALDSFDHSPLRILDCGCGSSYLTFAVYHYLNDIRGLPAQLMGVDVSETLIEKSNALSQQLGADMGFFCSPIADYQPDQPPDLVIALHACNTATDDALALGIRQNAGIILAVPCCHHDLNRQLQSREPFQPVLRHGILKQRLADILTDTFRALILRIMGYKTDVIEFVSSEHTDRNLMIRAVKRADPGAPEFVREYLDLKTYWQVTPYLETLLGADLQHWLG